MSSMKILCHVGPWSDRYLNQVCKTIEPDAEILITSGHKNVDKSGLASRYYDFLNKNKKSNYRPTERDIEVIARCRLLRAIDLKEALLHLNSMKDAIKELFDKFSPDLLVCETIDSFLMDILFEEANIRGVKSVGLVSCFVNGYFRVSARGEFNHLRSPSEEEVASVLEMMEGKNYIPNFIESKGFGPNYRVTKRWLRNLIKPIYFRFKRVISGEKYNYHYWATQVVSTDWLHPFPRLWLGDKKWKIKLKERNQAVIYVPLQMFPEATVDYWCEDKDLIDYDNILLEFIEKHSSNFNFLIKEHPNVLGYRNPRLYKRLSSCRNVIICPTYVNSNSIADLYDAVLVWTGSVGFESAIRGKPVITFCKPYYVSGDRFMTIDKSTQSSSIANFISRSKPIEHAEKLDLVRYLISGLFPGKLIVDGSWNEFNKEHQALARNLGLQLKKNVFGHGD